MGKRLFVGNLPYSVSDEDLRKLFSQAGVVESTQIMTEQESGRSRGFGYVQMVTDADVQNAIRMFDGYLCNNRQLRVNPATPPRASRSGPPSDVWGEFYGPHRWRAGL